MIYSVCTAPFGIKTVVSNPSNREIHRRIKTNKSNKFSSSEGNLCEEEKASKGQEIREMNTNSWSSNGKTKSRDYVLSRPPKKPKESGRERNV